MSNQIKPLTQTDTGEFRLPDMQILLMGGAIASLNIILMLFVSFYWTSPFFHTFISGKPL